MSDNSNRRLVAISEGISEDLVKSVIDAATEGHFPGMPENSTFPDKVRHVHSTLPSLSRDDVYFETASQALRFSALGEKGKTLARAYTQAVFAKLFRELESSCTGSEAGGATDPQTLSATQGSSIQADGSESRGG